MSYFLYELKTNLYSTKIIIGIFLVFICLWIGGAEYIFSSFPVGGIYLYKYAFSDGTNSIFVFTAPIIACIPYATSYIDELNSGFTNNIILKLELKKYILIKIIISVFLGGLILLIGCSLFFIFCIILKGINGNEITLNDSIAYLYYQSPIKYMVIEIFQIFTFGCVFSSICLMISAFLKNKYLAITATFFVYLSIGIITFDILPMLNLQLLYDISLGPSISIIYRIIYGVLMIICCGTIFFVKCGRKERYFE